jgi:FAD/FMN-containing dehydrogenase
MGLANMETMTVSIAPLSLSLQHCHLEYAYQYLAGIASATAKDIFGPNYERVLALKKEYDPGNLFSKGAGKFPL